MQSSYDRLFELGKAQRSPHDGDMRKYFAAQTPETYELGPPKMGGLIAGRCPLCVKYEKIQLMGGRQ
jgi:hypothetical protein